MDKVLEDTGQLMQRETVVCAAIQEHSELQNVNLAVVIQHNDGTMCPDHGWNQHKTCWYSLKS